MMTERIINSRTFSITGEFDSTLLEAYNVKITTTENNRVFIECTSLDDAKAVNQVLTDANLNPYNVSYSLFYKAGYELESEEAVREAFVAICPTANITYMRLDPNSTTGKLVVDTLDDYQTFKAKNDDEEFGIKFFHFNGRRSRGPRTEQVDRVPKKTTKVVKKTKKTTAEL